ncbi:Hypothetical protein D9617_17g046920 [Elsinoe fawcettii]|nr:Hypothetical protein D9617_17g046920 [Elsinoe fawcettii]
MASRPRSHRLFLLPTSLLALLITPTNAQSTTLIRTTSTSSIWSPLPPNPSFTHPSNLPTIPLPTATTTSDPTIPGLPPTTGSSNRPPTSEQTDRDNLVNLYFVFLLLLVLLFGLVAWLYYRRRKRRMTAIREGQRSALERDLSSGSGDWFGFLTSGREGRRRWLPALGRGQEGLDERGEAPPPYEARKNEERGLRLRDLGEGGKPPDYEVVEVGSPTVGGSTVGGSVRSGSSRSQGSTVREDGNTVREDRR